MNTKEKKKFNKEVGEFVTTAAILFGINILTSPGYLWCLWAVGFWGAALLGKYVKLKMDDDLDDDYEDYLELDSPKEYEYNDRKNWNEKDLV